jgi:hypothetical protein
MCSLLIEHLYILKRIRVIQWHFLENACDHFVTITLIRVWHMSLWFVTWPWLRPTRREGLGGFYGSLSDYLWPICLWGRQSCEANEHQEEFCNMMRGFIAFSQGHLVAFTYRLDERSRRSFFQKLQPSLIALTCRLPPAWLTLFIWIQRFNAANTMPAIGHYPEPVHNFILTYQSPISVI